MSSPEPIPVPTAGVRQRRRIPLIWIVPLVTALIAGWLAWDTWSKRGPTITVSFDSADGLQAGQSQLKFKDVNIGEADKVLKIAASLGLKPDLNDQAIKDKTRAEVDAAVAKGVFGSPYIVVDGEPFWGMDRFDQLERWLREPF